ncbi:hypothetical protein HanIR_Chr07g0309351 [Helianthus annuus]|nr:hypothetical protein HanIR_Chr07g0309351 [Helianthus annuus]
MHPSRKLGFPQARTGVQTIIGLGKPQCFTFDGGGDRTSATHIAQISFHHSTKGSLAHT